MNNNYASNAEVVRNLAQLSQFKVVETLEPFRIVQFEPPYFDGSEFWVVNEKGFLWEPAESLDKALDYVMGDEAEEYRRRAGTE
jgi:hypothetical protein